MKQKDAAAQIRRLASRQESIKTGEEFNEELLLTFMAAYQHRQLGEREDVLIIRHDIHTANALMPDGLRSMHRSMIKMGVKMCDAKIALPVAVRAQRDRLNEELHKMIRRIYDERT